jgi:transcriptional regulator with XRE-family HTH domain
LGQTFHPPAVRSTHSARYREFLKRLKRARQLAGLTQVEVAHALGKHQSYVAKCETGERRVDVIELAAFAEMYGRSLRYFVPPR